MALKALMALMTTNRPRHGGYRYKTWKFCVGSVAGYIISNIVTFIIFMTIMRLLS